VIPTLSESEEEEISLAGFLVIPSGARNPPFACGVSAAGENRFLDG
jgi:hypothetical protein